LRLVRDVRAVEGLAEVGVVLLLFTVGLELELPNLRRLGRIVWVAGPIQVVGTIVLAGAVGVAAGYGLDRSLFFGFLVSLSSTAIVLKLLIDRGEMDSLHGRLLLGILIFQDLAVVPMMLLVEPLSLGAGEGAMIGALVALGKTLLTAVVLFVAARFLVPRFLERVVGTRRKELFIVAVLVLVLGTALATSAAGLSLALGAFLAGLVLSESDFGHQAMADISPFRDAFNALFFVSIGMLFDFTTLARQPVAVAGILGFLLLAKTFWGALPVLFLGFGLRVATVVGISLAQIGEFSFVLLRQGLKARLIEPETYQVFLAAAILSMIAAPLLSEGSHPLAERIGGALAKRPAGRKAETGSSPLPGQDHALVLGFGHMGETLARVFSRAKLPFRILDLQLDRVRRGARRGLPVEYGDATNDTVLKRAGIERARAVIVVLSDPRATRQAVRLCRALAPGVFILVRTRYLSEIPELSARGADEVVAEEFETSLEIAGRALRRLGFPLPWVESETEEIRQGRHDGFRRFRTPGASPEGVRKALGGTRVEFLSVGRDWVAAGKSLRELDLPGAGGTIVLAVVREGNPSVTPSADFQLQASDDVLLLGDDTSLERSLVLLRGKNPA
jgi:CPA2 family monovalent cation:H+ antiporter-2